ncbi:MAG: hypothetical protein ACKPCM_09820 [Pseudanabaena sp.]
MKKFRVVLNCTLGLVTALTMETTIISLHEVSPVVAQPKLGKYSGDSKYWFPDYVGTIQIRLTSSWSYTAIADVELKQKPPDISTTLYDPNPTSFQYEMRGAVTVINPIPYYL